MIWRAAVWVIAVSIWLTVAAYSSVGPVLWVVREGNGLHYTDVAFGLVLFWVAWLITWPLPPDE